LEAINILAILLAPLIALQVSEWLERRRDKRNRRLQIFKTLMATRATPLHLDHINALNMIDIEFYRDDDKAKCVVEAWKLLHAHLHDTSYSLENGKIDPNRILQWGDKLNDLMINMLHEMAKCVGYTFEKSSLKKTSYFPSGYGELEQQGHLVREGLAKLFSGKYAIPIEIKDGTIKKMGEI